MLKSNKHEKFLKELKETLEQRLHLYNTDINCEKEQQKLLQKIKNLLDV